MKRFVSLLIAVTLLMGVVGCGNKPMSQESEPSGTATEENSAPDESTTEQGLTEDEPGETVITDLIGREVTVVPGSYKRVVCVGAGSLRMFTYVCDVSLLCGVEDIDNLSLSERPKMFDGVARPYVMAFGEQFRNLPSCGVGGPMAQTAEAEKILLCNPDIVISEFGDVEKEDALQEQLGVPVITLKSGAQGVFDESFGKSIRLLGLLFGQQERAEQLMSYVEAQREEISRRTANVAEADKPNVYVCGLGNWGTTNHLMTAEKYISFQVANVKNVLEDTGAKGVQPIEEEKFVAIGEKTDIMIMDAAAIKNIKPLYKEDPTMFDTNKAWQNGEVYLEMAYNAYYTNYEIVLANTWYIAKTVYPELFADVDMTEKLNEITKEFLGKEMAEDIFACPTSFGGYQKVDTEEFLK